MGLKVFLTDDSAFMRTMLKNLITKEGHEVIGEGADGSEAVEKVPQLKPDLVFMDIMMPNMNGIEALKKIKEISPETKVIMCTSVGQEKVITEAVEAGASEFVIKPFKPDDIHEVLSKYSQ